MGERKKNLHADDFSFRPFSRLGRLLSERGISVSVSKREDKEEISDEELFSEAMSKVHEISAFREMNVKIPDIAPLPKTGDGDRIAERLKAIVSGKDPIDLKDTQEYVEWKNPDYKSNRISVLQEGGVSVQDFLDLHGYTLAEAEIAVGDFIKDSLRNGFCCIKIIHGRGLGSPRGPVLKNAVVKWLACNYRKNIIAFVSARQCDGGLGAVYVLLKNRL